MPEPTPKADPSTLTPTKTDFPMDARPSTLEPVAVSKWRHQRTFEAMRARNAAGPAFVLHAESQGNGQRRADFALHALLEDLVVKYRALCGYQVDAVPSEQFARLGVLGRPSTASPPSQPGAPELLVLADLAQKGLLVHARRPTWWCPREQQPLADPEVQFTEQTSPSAFVAFEVTADLSHLSSMLTHRRVSLATWTCAPWTLPATVGIAVHPDLEYVFYALDDVRAVVVAKDLLLPTLSTIAPGHLKTSSVKLGEGTFDATALTDKTRVLAYALGSDLEGLVSRHPFLERGGLVVTGTHVDLESGTGLSPLAPGLEREDFAVGQAHGLDPLEVTTPDGRYDQRAPERLRGLTTAQATPVVLQWLVEVGALLNPLGETVVTPQPTCSRCAAPLLSRLMPQWLISMEGLRAQALEAIDQAIEWTPSAERARSRELLETRTDWRVSGPHPSGVPFPAVTCEDCGHAEVLRQGARGPVRCPACDGPRFRKEADVLDPAFLAACSFAVTSSRLGRALPFDLAMGAGAPYRTWLVDSLVVSLASRGVPPVRASLTHGAVAGEGALPDELIERAGADALRLWAAASDCRPDERFTSAIVENAAGQVVTLRRALHFALSNLFDFDPGLHTVDAARLEPLERWILGRFDDLIATARDAFDGLDFPRVVHAVLDFCSTEYFAIRGRALQTRRADGPARRSAQTALYRIAHDLAVMLAPITSFLSEEAFSFLPGTKPASVFLADFPMARGPGDANAVEEVQRLVSLRAAVLPLLEKARARAEEACVRLSATGELRALLERWQVDLPEFFGVSQVLLVDDAAHQLAPGVKADVALATGKPCPRCGLHAPEVDTQRYCQRCVDALA